MYFRNVMCYEDSLDCAIGLSELEPMGLYLNVCSSIMGFYPQSYPAFQIGNGL